MTVSLQDTKNRWEETTLNPALARFPERKPSFQTSSGIGVERVYLPDEGAESDAYLDRLGFPGEYPYTRGVQPTMYRGRLWTMRSTRLCTAEEPRPYRSCWVPATGERRLRLPTRSATTPTTRCAGRSGQGRREHPRARHGAAVRGHSAGQVSTSMTINAPPPSAGDVHRVGKRQGVEPRQLRGTVQNDILKEYIARGTYIFPPRPSMRLITDLFAYCAREVPKWNTISISGYHIREAGSTAVQEVAFTLANGIAYVQAALDAGLGVDDFAPQLSFFFNAHNNFLEEIAKFRAARRLWARIMRERFGAQDPRSWQLKFHAHTGASTLTAQQPGNNIVRVTLQALAAVLGGTQSLHTNSMDEALALPTEAAVRSRWHAAIMPRIRRGRHGRPVAAANHRSADANQIEGGGGIHQPH